MWQTITWTEVLAIVFFALTAIGALIVGFGKLTLVLIKRQVDGMVADVNDLAKKCDEQERELSDFKNKVATDYATHAIVSLNQHNIEEAIRGIYSRFDTQSQRFDDKIDKITDRLDRVLEKIPTVSGA